MRRIAAGVETGDHDHGVLVDYKKQRVRKAPQKGERRHFKHDGKLSGIITHPIDQRVNRLAKTPPQPGYFPFIPVLRINQLLPCGRGEDYGMTRATLLKFSFQGRPSYPRPPILVKRTEAVFKLGLLRSRQGKLLVFETIPKLCDERQTFRGRRG